MIKEEWIPPTPPEGSSPITPGDGTSTPSGDRASLESSSFYYCKKCDGNKTGDECDSVIENGGKCQEYDFVKIANEINDMWKSNYPNFDPARNKIHPNSLKMSNGKLQFYGEAADLKTDMWLDIKKVDKGNQDFVWQFYRDGSWKDLGTDYFTQTPEAIDESIKEQMNMQKSISDKIEEKLRDIFFYTVTEKGKERIVFDLEDKKDIEQELRALSKQNILGDRAFVMAVVRSQGLDKNDDLIVKLGSYPKDSNIDIGLKDKGLDSLIGTQYFSIVNNEGPDFRDFEIVKGDVYNNIPIKNKKEEKLPTPEPQQSSPPVKEEPYEVVMKQKERKGLESLLDTNKVNNNFTKKQKELLEKLKSQGYLFSEPKETGYEKKRVKSKEFTETFNVWKKRD